MRKRSTGIVIAVLVAGVVATGTVPASAHDPNGYGWAASSKEEGAVVGGGKHWYGVHSNTNGTNVRNDSSYYHAKKKHRTSVSNGNGTVRSADQPAGIWARADQYATNSGNKAWWYAY